MNQLDMEKLILNLRCLSQQSREKEKGKKGSRKTLITIELMGD